MAEQWKQGDAVWWNPGPYPGLPPEWWPGVASGWRTKSGDECIVDKSDFFWTNGQSLYIAPGNLRFRDPALNGKDKPTAESEARHE